jgi:hypothetical protein
VIWGRCMLGGSAMQDGCKNLQNLTAEPKLLW